MPPHVQKEILELEQKNPGIILEPWGFEEFRLLLQRISRADFESWFGYAPTLATRAKLDFEDLRIVLENISLQYFANEHPVKDVPPGKIEANALSPSIGQLLKEGMTKTLLVDEFFSKWHDPNFGERVADTFRAKYASLRNENLIPNQIFHDLQAWAGGIQRGNAEHELAVLTVLSYYFERCDIFEEPRPQL